MVGWMRKQTNKAERLMKSKKFACIDMIIYFNIERSSLTMILNLNHSAFYIINIGYCHITFNMDRAGLNCLCSFIARHLNTKCMLTVHMLIFINMIMNWVIKFELCTWQRPRSKTEFEYLYFDLNAVFLSVARGVYVKQIILSEMYTKFLCRTLNTMLWEIFFEIIV